MIPPYILPLKGARLKDETLNELADAINAERKKIIDERERYRMALAWYADKKNWRSMAVHSDKGDRARQALNHGRGEF